MKGIIFVEFLEMIDEKMGMEVTEELVEKSDLPSGGVYTTIGTYDDAEMISLVVNLHKKTALPIPALLKTFGEYLFTRFVLRYTSMIANFTSGFDLLRQIDDNIHVEVAKLYPNANLPHFSYEQINENTLKLTYQSNRKMPDLAEGLIEAAMKHFNEAHQIEREYIQEDGSIVNFIITKTTTAPTSI